MVRWCCLGMKSIPPEKRSEQVREMREGQEGSQLTESKPQTTNCTSLKYTTQPWRSVVLPSFATLRNSNFIGPSWNDSSNTQEGVFSSLCPAVELLLELADDDRSLNADASKLGMWFESTGQKCKLRTASGCDIHRCPDATSRGTMSK